MSFGLTQLAKSRTRGWLTSDGRGPTNLDLFHKLDQVVTNLEKQDVVVGFFHVRRKVCCALPWKVCSPDSSAQDNTIADELAKTAAREAARTAAHDQERRVFLSGALFVA